MENDFKLLILLFSYFLLILHLNFLSFACKLGLHQSKYKQSSCGFDTRTFVYLLETIWCTCQWVNKFLALLSGTLFFILVCLHIPILKQSVFIFYLFVFIFLRKTIFLYSLLHFLTNKVSFSSESMLARWNLRRT